MSRLGVDNTKGILRQGWFSTVDDYAISGGWALRGKLLVVGDTQAGCMALKAHLEEEMGKAYDTQRRIALFVNSCKWKANRHRRSRWPCHDLGCR